AALAVGEGVADFDAEAAGCLGLPPGRNTTSRMATSAAASTAPAPISARLRIWRCRASRCSCWRRYFSLACLRWRSFLPATGCVLLGLSHYPLPLVFTGGRPTNPMHTSDRESGAASVREGRPSPEPRHIRDRSRIVPSRCPDRYPSLSVRGHAGSLGSLRHRTVRKDGCARCRVPGWRVCGQLLCG